MRKAFGTAAALAALLVWSFPLSAASAGSGAADRDIAKITISVFPSVVRVVAENHTRKVATGVVVDKDGHVVTTALISPRDEKITIVTSDNRKIEAEFLGFDSETHLAVLRAKDKSLAPLAMETVTAVVPGSWVCQVGISPESTAAVTQGIVSSVSGDRLRLNIWVTPGSPGSPVVDENGQMIGLLRGIYTEEQPLFVEFRDKVQAGQGFLLSRAEAPSSGMALAIPVDVVKSVVAQIKEKGKVVRGWLGVSIARNQDGQIEVIGIDSESPAELSKLREGDVILSLDGQKVATTEALGKEIRKRKPGQDVTLGIERDGKAMDVRIKLGEYPEDEARRELELKFPGLFPPDETVRVLPKATKPDRFFRSYEKRTYIGVYCNELSRELAGHFGVESGTGLIISQLTKDGPAEKAGLKVGDVIVKVDGRRVETLDELIDVVQDGKKGDKVKVEFLRDKKAMSLEVEVAEEELGGVLGLDTYRDALELWQRSADSLSRTLGKTDDLLVRKMDKNVTQIQKELNRIKPMTKRQTSFYLSDFRKI